MVGVLYDVLGILDVAGAEIDGVHCLGAYLLCPL